MNKIFKVIYSKVRNCYVVTSEFAKANTKSSTGSEKSKTGKKALLTLAVASAIMCGGLMNVGATVHVEEVPSGTKTVYETTEVDSKLNDKLDKTQAENTYGKATDVAANTANIAKNTADIAKKIDKDTADATYAKSSEVYTKTEVNDALTAASTNVNTKLADYAKTADVNAELAKKADTDSVYSKTEANNTFTTKDELNATKTELEGKITNNTTNITSNKEAIDDLKTKVGDATGGLTKTVNDLTGKVNTVESDITNLKDKDVALEGKINANSNDITGLKDKDVELEDKINTAKSELNAKIDNTKTELSNADTALDTKITANKDKIQQNTDNIAANKTAIDTLKNNVGTVTGGDYLDGSDTIAGNLGRLNTGLTDEVAARTAADTALGGRIDTEKSEREAADTAINAKIGTIDDVQTNYVKNANSISQNLTKLDKELKDTNDRTAGIKRDDVHNETVIEGKVTIDQDGNVSKVKDLGAEKVTTGSLETTGKSELKGDVTLGTDVNNTVTVNGKTTFKENVKVEKDLTVDGKLNVGEIAMKNDKLDADGKKHDSATTITADGISNIASVKESGKTTESQFTHNEKGTFNHAKEGDSTDWKEATSNVTANGVGNIAKDSQGNNNTFTQTATDTTNTLTDAAGNTSSTRQDAKGNYGFVKDAAGNKSYTKQEGNRIAESVIGKDGKETKSEMTTTDITNTAKSGTIKNDAKNIENIASGNIKNSSATMDTTVTGKATESYGELETTIKGNETHNVDGNQTSTIKGTQSTTVKGDVIEDYKKDLTTKVGGNELHEVTGKVTENFKGGQETNVTGDQTTTVSGTQTTNATDINRNASSGMIDKVDNAYGTNTETKVAGKTTTEVTIKGTGEKGEYIRGANEAKDTLTKGTLKNSETKTAEATSTEITDGSGNTSSTIQDKANLAGSVTNGTETGVSGIHGNVDGSVSIDSSVADKSGNISTINQKKGSITSTVSDGTNATVISQDKSNVTIVSNNGTIAIGGKDIINNATDTITNTAGTKITDTAGDSSVTTENGKGTTFTKTDSTAFSDATDAPTNTNISGNQVTTGRLDANELGISDKDGNNTADLNVKAGNNSGVSASAGNGTTTGSLDVKADEVGSSVKDAAGNGSAFRQRIDEIIGKVGDGTTETEINQGVKDITNTAKGGTIKNDAKDIVNEASDSITEKVGDTNVTTKKKDSTKSVIENTNTVTTIEQTDEQVQTSVSSKDGKKSNISTNYDNAAANQVTEDGQTSTVINNKNGLLIQNSDNQTGFTTEDGTATGTAQGWTNIKGNEISTGKLEANYAKMDYADVMKDLGVRGNANIAGKTTTGELEVTGKSTLKGDVTMEGNATVKNDLTVDGTTTTKDLNVIQNATIGGTLDVTGKASFKDSVDITNNLTVGGNATITGDVTANSYKVGNHTYIDSNGINANGQVIRNVGAGEISETSTDAVNGSQLFATNRRIEQFDSRINEVGANAAAIANLHPMEFDADSKMNVAVGVGNYRNKTATAMGVFYRPNEDVMFNVSSTIGSNDNMVGGGVSFRLGSGGNKQKNKALAEAAEQNKQLKSQVDTLQAQMDALLSVINPNMSKDFPDVPDNHWAYEAVTRLAGNDIIQGYEDGKYHGERTMTRYEMAAIIYKALQKGAKAEAKLVEEFKPELKALAAHEKA